MRSCSAARRRCAAVIAALTLLLGARAPAFAQSQETDASSTPSSASEGPAYRRVFVPADRAEEWPTGGEQFLPINRAEFERLSADAEEGRSLADAGAVQLASARYTATIAADGTLAGSGSYQLELIEGVPRFLSLSPLNVEIRKARWAQESGAEQHADVDREALVGAWSRAGASGYGVLVEQSGRLAFEWFATPNNAEAVDLEYSLELPRALQQIFTIDLPGGARPSLTSARLVSSEPQAQGALTRWTFHLAVADEHRLRILRRSLAASAKASLPLAAMSEAYTIGAKGLDYEAELRIQTATAYPLELRLSATRSLRITEVLVDRSPVDWRFDEQDADTVVAPLPASASPLTATVRGVAEIVVEKPWKLPSIELENVFWTEGASTLWVDPKLELQSLTPRGGDLLNLIGVGQPAGGEAYRLQAWNSEASTEVFLAERTAALHIDSGVSVEFADRELTGRCRARISATLGSALQLTAAIGSDWNVDAVESDPPDALAQWHVAGEGSQRRLHVQFRRSPTELTPAVLSVSARKPLRGWSPAATLGELNWINFRGSSGDHRLLISDRRGGDLISDPGTLESTLVLGSLAEPHRTLLGAPTKGLLFDAMRLNAESRIRSAPSRPSFQAESWHELARTRSGFDHLTQLHVRPTAGAVGELIVTAARELPADARWTLADSGDVPAVERVAPSGVQPNGVASGAAATYRVRFSEPRNNPFSIVVSWRGDKQRVESVNSFVVPAADAWQSWAVLRGDAARVGVEANGCTPAAALPLRTASQDAPPILGCYRLGDDPLAPPPPAPALRVIAGASTAARLGVTSPYYDVVTLHFADGRQLHRFEYRLEVSEPGPVELKLPTDCELVSAQLGGAPALTGEVGAGAKTLQIPLSLEHSGATLIVDLQSQGERLPTGARVLPSLLRTSFPAGRGRWTIAAPAPFVVETEAQRQVNAGWRQRLFGPMARVPSSDAGGLFDAQSSNAVEPNRYRPTAGAGQSAIPRGWTTATQEFVTLPEPVAIRRSDDSRAAWHVAWLISAVAAACVWSIRPRWVAGVVAAATMCCLLVPAVWLALPQAILLGGVGGAGLRLILRSTLSSDDVRTGWLASKPAGLLLLLTCVPSGALCCAAEAVSSPAVVFYPIDDQGKPAGDDVYASSKLLGDLIAQTAASGYDGASSVLLDARLHFELSQSSDDVHCDVGTIRLRWRTFVANAVLQLPLHRDDGEWIPAEHTLNGAAVAVRWADNGLSGSVQAGDPGEYELALKFSPRWTRGAGINELAMRIPPLPGTRVEVKRPAGLELLTINDRKFSESDGDTSSARLAAVDEVRIAWSPHAQNSSAVVVDQLSWLHVDPVLARLDVRLRITGDGSSLKALQLEVPPQLKLMALPVDSPVEVVQSRVGASWVTNLQFQNPPSLPLEITLPFQIQRSVSIGHVRFPQVRVANATIGVRQFAASVDARLRVHEDSPVGMSPIPIGEVERVWGTLPSAPTMQYSSVAAAPEWSMYLEPTPPQFTAEESMQLLCETGAAQVNYAARFKTVEGVHLTHQLSVSPALEVRDVTVAINGGAGPDLRWSRPRPDQLCVFLSRPVREPYELRVVGQAAYSGDGDLIVPKIRLENNDAKAVALAIRRTSDVLVHWSDGRPSHPPSSTNAVALAAGLPVGQFTVLPEDAAPLRITRNNAQFSADAIFTISHVGADAVGTLVLRGRVNEGIVDRLQLQVSKSWQGAFTSKPEAKLVIHPLPQDAERNQIEIMLKEPVEADEDFSLQLTGKLALGVDQRIRFPQVRIQGAAEQRVFLALPKTPDGQTSEWTIRGLQRQDAPPALLADAPQARATETHRIRQDQFVAEQRVFPVALRRASVRLALTDAVLDSEGRWSAVTEFIIQPGGAADLQVQIPAAATLLAAAVNDHAIARPTIQGRHWRLPQGPRYLPQIVRVAYQITKPDGAARFALQTPKVLVEGQPLRVERALWQLHGEPALQLVADDHEMAISSSTFVTASRRETLAAVIDAAPLAFQLADWEHDRWFQPWVRRLDGSATLSEEDVTAKERTWNRLRQQFASSKSASEEHADQPQLAAEAVAFPGVAWFQSASGGELMLAPATRGLGAGRWLLALALAGAAIAAWKNPARVQAVLKPLRRWPPLIGIAVGLVWWALLAPALLGPAIIALSLAALFKNRQLELAALARGGVSTPAGTSAAGAG